MCRFKKCILCILFLAAKLCVYAQNAPAPKAAGIKLSFEKVYLHTDRDVYALGDTLWFKAYLVNAQDNKPAASSGNLYVELIAPDSARMVNREIIRLENGLGKGDITLGDSVRAGHYKLRAYTNWMRNFGDNFVFEKDITVLDASANPAAKTSKTNTITTSGTASTATTIASASTPTVRFYPEGGSLVEGLSAIVGVKAEDAAGKGIPLSGAILSASGDTVSRFSCDDLGMGVFAMLPIAGQTYHAVANKVSFSFPNAISKGFTLQIRQTDSLIHAIVSTSDTTVKATSLLTVKHGGVTLLSQQFQMKAQQLSVRIPTGTLPEGIAAITLYDDQSRPECERLVYIHHPGSKNKVNITTNKNTYKSKEQVTVSINAQPNASLSMAVVDASMVPLKAGNIISYLNLQSEIRGNIEQPDRYFDSTNVDREKQLNELMLTQGWRDFVWRRLADTAIHISYAAENGITIAGSVKDENLNRAIPGANLTLYTPDAKGTKLYTGRTDSLGLFNFGGLMLYGQQNIRITSVNGKGEKRGSITVDTMAHIPVQLAPSNPASSAAAAVATSAIEQRVTDMKMARISGVTKLKEVSIRAKKNIVTRSGAVLTNWGADQEFDIKPEDAQYKTLEWYLLQHIKGVRQSSPPGPTGVVFSGVDTSGRRVPNMSGSGITVNQGRTVLMPPLLIVNGKELYMDEPTQAEAYRITYFNMPITKFKHIVLKHMVGTLHGVKADGSMMSASQETQMVDRYLLYLTLDENAMISNPGSLSMDISGYYEARNFYEPGPGSKPSVADYRTTVHWEPNIKTDAAGKATINFYNAVPQSNTRIMIEGITNTGIPLNGTGGYQTK
jgi:hypothetical protein